MENLNLTWTEERFKAYVLVYCMHADFVESEEEKELIQSKVGKEMFDSVRHEFLRDNDFQRVQKIQQAAEILNFDQNKFKAFCDEIKEIFLSDGKFDILERNFYLGLKHILE